MSTPSVCNTVLPGAPACVTPQYVIPTQDVIIAARCLTRVSNLQNAATTENMRTNDYEDKTPWPYNSDADQTPLASCAQTYRI